MNNDCNHVLVIGAANLDIKGIPEEPLLAGTSIPGQIRTSLGGVARNIAENLARLDVDTVLLTAVGDDPTGVEVELLVRRGCHGGVLLLHLGAQLVAVDR